VVRGGAGGGGGGADEGFPLLSSLYFCARLGGT